MIYYHFSCFFNKDTSLVISTHTFIFKPSRFFFYLLLKRVLLMIVSI